MAARKIERKPVQARPLLKVVLGGSNRRAASKRSSITIIQRATALSLVILLLSGGMRVALTTEAAEAGLAAWKVQSELEVEEQIARGLEADVNALSDPARIEALAAETLNMSRPEAVSHITIPGTDSTVLDLCDLDEGAQEIMTGKMLTDGLVATLLDLAACEAGVMLVGDMGIGPGQ